MLDIYQYPDLYDSMHQNYSLDAELISKFSQKNGGPVLELASGTGRLSEIIIDQGLDYTGIDFSKEFIDTAKNKFKQKSNFLLGDMRNFNLDKKFKFIFIGFH